MRSPIFIIFICLNSVNGLAQRFTIEELKNVSESGVTTTFPVFHSKNIDTDVKINTTLQQIISGLNDDLKLLDYDVKLNSSKVLAVEFDKEDCTRSYCEEYPNYYNFDARTGVLIDIEKLFTGDGFQQVQGIIYETRRKTINKFLKKARDTNSKEAFAMYTECLESLSREDVVRGGFYFDNEKIHFIRFACSPYIQRELDEIGVFDDAITFKSLKKNLSAYGKDLIK